MTRDEKIGYALGWRPCACGDQHCDAWFNPAGESAFLPKFDDADEKRAEAVSLERTRKLVASECIHDWMLEPGSDDFCICKKCGTRWRRGRDYT